MISLNEKDLPLYPQILEGLVPTVRQRTLQGQTDFDNAVNFCLTLKEKSTILQIRQMSCMGDIASGNVELDNR